MNVEHCKVFCYNCEAICTYRQQQKYQEKGSSERERADGFTLGQQINKVEEKPKSTRTIVCKMDFETGGSQRERETSQNKIK